VSCRKKKLYEGKGLEQVALQGQDAANSAVSAENAAPFRESSSLTIALVADAKLESDDSPPQLHNN